MSLDGRGGVLAVQELYFCYQCNRTVPIIPSPNSELLCPDCNGGFLEEYENPNPPIPNPNPFLTFPPHNLSFSGPSPFILSHRPTRSLTLQGPADFNPLAFLQNYLRAGGGTNIQLVIENNHHEDHAFRIPSNLGDYFVSGGLEQLIQQLAENDPNRYGTPPASKSAIQALPNIKITHQLLASDSSQCAVCKDTFELGQEAKQMPCKHIYHSNCIMPWLEMHNSCPVCRYELPTDDPDYENRNRTRRASNPSSSTASASQENPETRTVERRFRISLPWPFSAFWSSAETSNSVNNAGDSNSGSGGQARQEDFD